MLYPSTYVMIRVSSPGSPKTPSTNSGIEVKLYLLQDLPSSKLNLLETNKQKKTVEAIPPGRDNIVARCVVQVGPGLIGSEKCNPRQILADFRKLQFCDITVYFDFSQRLNNSKGGKLQVNYMLNQAIQN